ncbi:MAG: VanZ family protein [Desulfovibrionales bacterium]|nr:MAG: VanZ family protein [Desulfovibrionales bacterium]
MKIIDKRRASTPRFRQPGFRGLVADRILSRPLSLVIPVAYMALILIAASVPDDESLGERHYLWFLLLVGPTLMNLLHIPAYGLLAFLWRWSLDRYMAARAAVWLAFILTVGFGLFQEWYQSMIPGRFASLMDVIFNTLGAGIGLWVFNRCVSGSQRRAA